MNEFNDSPQSSSISVNALYDQLKKEPLDAEVLCGDAEELAVEVVEVVCQGTDQNLIWQTERLPGIIIEVEEMLAKLAKLKTKHHDDAYGQVMSDQIATFETFLKEHPIHNREESTARV